MIIRYNKQKIIQYIALYLVLILSGSRVWVITMARNSGLYHAIEGLVIIAFLVCLARASVRKYLQYGLLCLGYLLGAVVFVRWWSGGVGIEVFLKWTTYIFIAWIAVTIDADSFIERFLKIVYVWALISIIGFLLQITVPDILKTILPEYASNFSYSLWGNGYNGELFSYRAWGRYLFSFDQMHPNRNVGIFSEPGVYQIVLNSALFCLLFLSKYKSTIEAKKKMRYFYVYAIALMTCQSTTGYIGFLAIILVYFLSSYNSIEKIKQRIIIATIVILLYLIVEYSINGTNSLLYRAFIRKLVTSSGTISVTADSGIYRMRTLIVTIGSMIKNPLGVGYDKVNTMINGYASDGDGGAGAVLFCTGAALGILTMLVIVFWTLYPVFKSRLIKMPAKLLFAFLFFNTALAQSEEIYATIIVVPIFLYVMLWNSQEVVKEDDMGHNVLKSKSQKIGKSE